jgi:hypothetical protein
MAKSSGLGAACYVGGNVLSNDIQSISKLSGSIATIDVTGIDKLAHERIGGQRSGEISLTAFWNSTGAHPVFAALPTTDVIVSYYDAGGIGLPAASMTAKQINYDPSRAQSGELLIGVNAMSNGFGLEWGQQLTAQMRTDTVATNGASVDSGVVSTLFGLQAYLHVSAFTGTDVTVKLQDSADNSSFTDIASAAFAQVTTAPQAQRIAISNAATVRRYVRAVTVTTGGFTSCTFAVTFTRNPIAGQVF